MRRCPTGGKMRYPSRYVAVNAARLRMLRPWVPELRVYVCPSCDGWHLTKSVRGGQSGVGAMQPQRLVSSSGMYRECTYIQDIQDGEAE